MVSGGDKKGAPECAPCGLLHFHGRIAIRPYSYFDINCFKFVIGGMAVGSVS
jgi:hypothetical protein